MLKAIRKSKALRVAVSLIVTLILGFLYFYIELPALNFQSSELYGFVFFLLLVYIICSFLLSFGI